MFDLVKSWFPQVAFMVSRISKVLRYLSTNTVLIDVVFLDSWAT